MYFIKLMHLEHDYFDISTIETELLMDFKVMICII